MILIFQDSRLYGLLVLSDWHIGRPPADGGEHAVDQLVPYGIENHHLVLTLIELPVIVGPKLRVVLDGRGGGVAQQGLHLLVGQVTGAGFTSHAAARTMFKAGHPGVTGQLPPVRGRPSDRRPLSPGCG